MQETTDYQQLQLDFKLPLKMVALASIIHSPKPWGERAIK